MNTVTRPSDFEENSVIPLPTKKHVNPSALGNAPNFIEDAIALRFVAKHGGELRYVAKWGKWMRWKGTHWEADETLHVFDLARKVCRQVSAEKANDPRARVSGQTVAIVERFARADRKLAATIDQWDADPWLLNTPDGVVDLRTGKLRPHKPDDYMTKITVVGPSGDCPLFLRFMNRIMGGDQEMVAYLQRVLGYALTGITSALLRLRNGRKRQGRVVLDGCRHPQGLPLRGADRDLQRLQQ
jgi:putative DNA primase/helicase